MKPVAPKVRDDELGTTIVIDKTTNELTLYQGFELDRRYSVATAIAPYETPSGAWTIINKAENPTWTNPAPDTWGADLPLTIPPGPGNPLGTRALYLNAPGIRIHGTYDSDSIGTHASHGCIRMNIDDVEEIYPLVPDRRQGPHLLTGFWPAFWPALWPLRSRFGAIPATCL